MPSQPLPVPFRTKESWKPDPAILPIGSRIRITAAGVYNGIYTVTHRGAKINGRHIDLCLPNDAEAKQFGKNVVLVRILRIGAGK